MFSPAPLLFFLSLLLSSIPFSPKFEIALKFEALLHFYLSDNDIVDYMYMFVMCMFVMC